MFIDTHCHINMMVKKKFDTPMKPADYEQALEIVMEADRHNVSALINVGTSLPESSNCVELANKSSHVYAAVGIHPNDCTESWKEELKELEKWLQNKKILAIGECGLDFHYPGYNKQRQKDAFKKQIELSLTYDLALIIHTRDAREETTEIMHEFKGDIKRGIVHCFSEDLPFAQMAIDLGYALGIGGTLTYPKNDVLRNVAASVPLSSLVLETDAPFLPPQDMRGTQNHPRNIVNIAAYLAKLRSISLEEVGEITSKKAKEIFRLPL